MTTETAPGAMNTTNKRVRFEDPTSAPNDSPSQQTVNQNQSPKGLALSLIRAFTVTLRKHLSPIVLKCGESNLDLLHKMITKMNQFKKMDDDQDYIPRSANLINFEFRVTKEVENHDEFLVIKADTDQLMSEFKGAIKLKIMQALQLECRLLREKFYENVCTNMHLMVQAQLITDQSNLDPHKIVSTCLFYYFTELFDHTDLTIDELNATYKKTHGLPVFPFAIETPAGATNGMVLEDTVTEEDEGALTAMKNKDLCHPSLQLIRGALMRPGAAYFAREDAIKIDISLKKLLNTDTLEEATEATKVRLDAETSVDSELLEELVKKKVASKTKNLNAEIGQLKKQMAELTKKKPTGNTTPGTKKSGRGQPATKGASKNKKKSGTATRTPKKVTAPKAGDQDKGASRKEDGKKGNRGKKKKTKRRQS